MFAKALNITFPAAIELENWQNIIEKIASEFQLTLDNLGGLGGMLSLDILWEGGPQGKCQRMTCYRVPSTC